jgi:hypothetical protein
MSDIQQEKLDCLMENLNDVLKDHTKIIYLALDLYDDIASENLVEASTMSNYKLAVMKDALIKLTISAQSLLAVAEIQKKI